ncbi:MAG: RpiR family transcriptional regulator [Cereibacter sphaeroides]|uniref:RpiR family transcriptional regulator n=1 Tax=Cereibacter sphaeroides TaxID=1063 RepID=A0A2W5TUY0_CERSP|nr:MAG: RpiR family transcriptional regulator [Cereibacter sphaeroides]
MADQKAVQPQPADLRGRLEDCLRDATPANRTLASYFLSNLKDLPFETAASVATRVGISEATVGRFCRGIGYLHFKDLKSAIQAELGDQAWLVGDRLQDFATRQKQGASEISRGMEREMAAILANYETAASPGFARAVERLAHRKQVFVSGFQTERGHGQFLVNQLQYLRAGVQLLDLSAANFAEVLLAPPEDVCLVLIDGRRYSRLTRRLAIAAREAGIPVTLITDPYCPWARDVSDEAFVVQTDFNQFWDATSAMSSLIGLLVNGVFAELGPEVEQRMTKVSALYNDFIGHDGDPRRPLK